LNTQNPFLNPKSKQKERKTFKDFSFIPLSFVNMWVKENWKNKIISFVREKEKVFHSYTRNVNESIKINPTI
jgi:hypothetical protein